MYWTLALLAALLASVLLTHQSTQRVEKAFPPIGEITKINGLRVHYTDTGAGSPLVLIHGASTNLRDFHASLAGPLSEHHRVITVDRPGHGYSERPRGNWPDPAWQAALVQTLLEQLKVNRPVLVGHSWSGSVVLAHLLAFPDKAAGAVLLAGGSHPWEGGVAWYYDVAGVPLLGRLFAYTLVLPLGSLTLDAGLQAVFTPNPVPPDYRERTGVALSLRPQNFMANAEDVRRLSDFLGEQSSHYQEIEVPVLLITGATDTIVPPWNHAERLVVQASQADLMVLEQTGHALHHSAPARISQLILDFRARLQ